MIACEDGLPSGTSPSQSYVLESTTTLFMAVPQQNQAGLGVQGCEILHIRKHFDFHVLSAQTIHAACAAPGFAASATVGLCQPAAGVTLFTSFGPQVFGSY